MNIVQLTDKEKESEVWRKLAAHLNGLLDEAHIDLEKTTLSEVKTAAIRGRTKLIRQLLKLGDRTSLPSAEQSTDTEYR